MQILRKESGSGITLIELLVVLTIIGIVAGIAAPSLSSLMLDHRARQMQWQWRGFLGQARSAAISQQRWASVCPVQADQCTSDLTRPWIAFHDDNLNNRLDAPDETVIARLQPDGNVRFVMYRGNATLAYFRYRPSGLSGNLRGFTVCPDGTANHRAFHLTSTLLGRIRFARDTDGDGLVDRRYQGKQQNVTCP